MQARYLPVNEIFETIQGEGFHTGVPAVFVRLQGCDVGCSWCDTKHTWEVNLADEQAPSAIIGVSGDTPRWANYTAEQLVAHVRQYSAKHIVVTGGEPCLYDLNEFTELLIELDYSVQIETSGTYPIKTAAETWVTVSPKVDMKGGKQILIEALLRANEIKHPVSRAKDIENLYQLLFQIPSNKDVMICLQPISQHTRATELCIDTCIKNNWRLSLQTHKYIGID